MSDTDGITVVVAREVATGREEDFHHWVDDLLSSAQRFPGYLGSGLLEPAAGGSVWHVVYRFGSPEHLAAWESSPVRCELLDRGSDFVQTVAVRRLDGMDAWFAQPSGPASRPPRWKTFLMTATVILVLQFLLSAVLRPLVTEWPMFLRNAAVIIPLVGLMTWIVMPRLSQWLSGWLYAGRGG